MAHNAAVRPLMLMSFLSPLFGGTFSALYVIFAIKTLGLSPALMGMTVAVGGIGSLLGTADLGAAGATVRRRPDDRVRLSDFGRFVASSCRWRAVRWR